SPGFGVLWVLDVEILEETQLTYPWPQWNHHYPHSFACHEMSPPPSWVCARLPVISWAVIHDVRSAWSARASRVNHVTRRQGAPAHWGSRRPPGRARTRASERDHRCCGRPCRTPEPHRGGFGPPRRDRDPAAHGEPFPAEGTRRGVRGQRLR